MTKDTEFMPFDPKAYGRMTDDEKAAEIARLFPQPPPPQPDDEE